MNIPFGIMDLSLAPTPEIGDSVASSWYNCCPCSLNDAVKKVE